jgi:hypothetical protein
MSIIEPQTATVPTIVSLPIKKRAGRPPKPKKPHVKRLGNDMKKAQQIHKEKARLIREEIADAKAKIKQKYKRDKTKIPSRVGFKDDSFNASTLNPIKEKDDQKQDVVQTKKETQYENSQSQTQLTQADSADSTNSKIRKIIHTSDDSNNSDRQIIYQSNGKSNGKSKKKSKYYKSESESDDDSPRPKKGRSIKKQLDEFKTQLLNELKNNTSNYNGKKKKEQPMIQIINPPPKYNQVPSGPTNRPDPLMEQLHKNILNF